MLYFAYGSNMNQRQMKDRCPTARSICRAYVEGYRFVYDGHSEFWDGPVANIVESPGNTVWGALYEVDEVCLKSLDSHEGHPRVYKRKKVRVKTDSGEEKEAFVYLKDPKPTGKPSEDYRRVVVEGAREANLPEDYIRTSLKA